MSVLRFYRLTDTRLTDTRLDDVGMTTAEYAIGTVAAAGLAGLLYTVLTGQSVLSALTALVNHAMVAKF
jgi:hypothetical protein